MDSSLEKYLRALSEMGPSGPISVSQASTADWLELRSFYSALLSAQKRRKSGSLPGGRMSGMSQELTDHRCKPSFLPLAWGTPHISKERPGSEGLGAGVRGDSLGIDLNFLLPCFHPPKCHWAGSSCSLQLHWNVRLCSGDGIVPWAPQCL